MQIHVVQPNESLSRNCARLIVNRSDIIEANDLPNPNNLVVGQSLVIPIIGTFTWSSREILYLDLEKGGHCSAQELASINRNFCQSAPSCGFSSLYSPRPKKS